MLYFRIGFENGDSLKTGFNGTLEEAKAYYLGHVFNLGAVDDDMQRCNSVEQFPTLEMGLAAWIASGGLVVITDGTVSRQVVSVLVDGLDFRLVVDGWKNPVYLPMVDAYHLEGWKVEHSGSSLYIMPDGVNLF